ncbi:MAG: FadR family transcriptional regulator [Desulfobacterales bacterium]|nr:FadR family transcriptional regulator [Desulfobacterales bacterium]
MTASLKPIKPKRISDQVFDQLRDLIFRGKIKPGERLMPEREMAEAMNVSRATIRTAVQRLADMGLITQRQGQGTFVRSHDDNLQNPLAKAIEAQGISLETLLEVRLGLECNAAALAARRADENDISALTLSFKEMEKEQTYGRLGSQADSTFHMAIAYASKNPLHIMIMRDFYDYLFHGIRENLESLYQERENIHIILKQHEKILSAIQKREPEAAFNAMKDHIQFVVNFYNTRSN